MCKTPVAALLQAADTKETYGVTATVKDRKLDAFAIIEGDENCCAPSNLIN